MVVVQLGRPLKFIVEDMKLQLLLWAKISYNTWQLVVCHSSVRSYIAHNFVTYLFYL